MSRDESPSIGGGRSQRPLPSPHLPPGPTRELKQFLYRLYLAAGPPTLDAIADAVAADNDLKGSPSRDTIKRILSASALPPNRHDVTAVATVLGRDAGLDEHHVSRQAAELWTTARLAPPPALLGHPLAEVLASPEAPFMYEVHPAINAEPMDSDMAPMDPLPVYLERAHDRQLAKLITTVSTTGRVQAVVLVGGSSTGKTRACWEALRHLPDTGAGWRIWHPLTPTELVDGLGTSSPSTASIPVLAPRTVIWLNELQRYLIPADAQAGERVAAALRVLLRARDPGQVVVLGTIWKEPYWATLTATHTGPGTDPHSQARQLAALVTTIHVPDHFDRDSEGAETAAAQDPRWQVALREAPDKPVQFLAGAAHLLHRYHNATPTRRAVLDAAGDARRIGAPQHLPLAFLEHAARDYLSEDDWDLLPPTKRDPAVWVREALDGDPALDNDPSLARGARGVRGPLHAVRIRDTSGDRNHDPVYELADYLEQHLRHQRATTQPRDSLWDAATALTDPQVISTIAHAAQRRGRLKPAARLYETAATNGHPGAWIELAQLREQAGDHDGAEQAYQRAVAAGHPHAWTALAQLREQAGDRGAAEATARLAEAAGHPHAWAALAQLREQAGDRHGAEAAARLAEAAGYPYCWRLLATFREDKGDRDGAEDAARHAEAAGELDVWIDLITLRELVGDQDGAENAARAAAASGHPYGWSRLGRLLERAEDKDGAEQAYQRAAAGRPQGWAELARFLEQTGDRDGAEEAALHAEAGGHPYGWSWLATLREESGDRDGAEEAARHAEAGGKRDVWVELARIRERSGNRDGAEEAAGRAEAAGILNVRLELARIRELAGDRDGAEQAYQRAAAAGHPYAWAELAMLREQAGDRDGAEQAYQRAAAAGHPYAWAELARLREDAGKLEDADRIRRFGLTADGWPETGP